MQHPGYLMHMDQTESITTGRPMKYSGHNHKLKIHIITLFVDHISNKTFLEFQHTTNSEETLQSKQRMEKDAYT